MNGETLNTASTAEGMEKIVPIAQEEKVGVMDYQQASSIRFAYDSLEKALQKVRAKYDAIGEGEVKNMLGEILVDFISPASVISHVLYAQAYYEGDNDSMNDMLDHETELNRLDPRMTPFQPEQQPIQSEQYHI